MVIDFNFRHFQASVELVQYAIERFHRLKTEGGKSIRAHVVFSVQKKGMRVAVSMKGSGLDIFATGEAADFALSIDLAAERLERQLSRLRNRKASRRNAG